METEILRLWNIVSEIVDQLNQNRLITARLQSHAGQLQDQASQASDGDTLRRFNTDLSKGSLKTIASAISIFHRPENFTSELERLSVVLVMENQSLLHENKQLNTLMQDYEKTLETVMNKFRAQCHAAQTHQLTLNRHYEQLLGRERGDEPSLNHGIDSDHLETLTAFIRRVMRSMEGKDPLEEEQLDLAARERGEFAERETQRQGEECQGVGIWEEEREIEIQRLERENAELRRTLGISQEQERELGLEEIDTMSPIPSPAWDRPSFPQPVSFREDRGRGGGRTTLALGSGPQRRSALPVFMKRAFADSAPERVSSPPNEIPWGRDVVTAPVIETI